MTSKKSRVQTITKTEYVYKIDGTRDVGFLLLGFLIGVVTIIALFCLVIDQSDEFYNEYTKCDELQAQGIPVALDYSEFKVRVQKSSGSVAADMLDSIKCGLPDDVLNNLSKTERLLVLKQLGED